MVALNPSRRFESSDDALGRRVGRDDGTTASVYVQSGQQTIADYSSGAVASSPTYTYVYASYIDEPVMCGGSGGLKYYHRNQQYSIVAVTGGGSVVDAVCLHHVRRANYDFKEMLDRLNKSECGSCVVDKNSRFTRKEVRTVPSNRPKR